MIKSTIAEIEGMPDKLLVATKSGLAIMDMKDFSFEHL
jgi:hypothetical protein